MTRNSPTILDGGMGRQLARIGAPFRLPEWSGLALIETPHLVRKAHEQFIESGAEIITTNSYSIVPHQIGEARFAADGLELADRAGRVAREAADAAPHPVRVAGSIPPLFESYRPSQFDAGRAPEIVRVLVEGLAPHVDLWLVETQSLIAEVKTDIAALAGTGKPIWVSYTLKDEKGRAEPAEIRSGESVAAATAAAVAGGASAVLFNCSQPEAMLAAVREARAELARLGRDDVDVGVYANAFEPEAPSDTPYAAISEIRADLDPARYRGFAESWASAGATIIGGCCGIGPEHIHAVKERFRASPA